MAKIKAKYEIESSPLYALRSRARLAALLKINNRELRLLGNKSDTLYSEFGIAKASGGTREIENPANPLKAVQARLAELLMRIEPGDHLYCPAKGRSYIGNAAKHVDQTHIRCLDIKSFFPSVPARRVFWFYHRKMSCERDVAGLLTSISTYKEHLPTGSPLSPILAYYCYLEMWDRIKEFCVRRIYTLSVYVDDITISGNHVAGSDIWEIKKFVTSYGLRYHKERDYNSRPAMITGYVVANRTIAVPNKQYKKRRHLLEASLSDIDVKAKAKLVASLAGLNTQMLQIQRSLHNN